jgi:ketosteroid isomerase-like protein
MKHRTTFLTLAFVLALSSLARAQSPSAVDVVNKVVAASEVLDDSALIGLYTDNAVFVDEGPIVIYGPTVGYDWLTRVKQEFAERKMTQFKATASKPTIVQVSANGAYIVVPMELNAVVGADKHFHESGTFTFTLVRKAEQWKITSQVWTVLTKSVQ